MRISVSSPVIDDTPKILVSLEPEPLDSGLLTANRATLRAP